MKHVWILNHYAQQPGGAGGTRHHSLARHLPAFGWTASIIASGTEHNTGTQRLAVGEMHRIDVFDDVPFLWLRGSVYSGNGADRIRNMVDYTRAALNPANLEGLSKPDAVIGSSVHPLAAWAGRRLAARHDVPFLFEVRDLWPETLIDMGRLSRYHPLAFALRRLETSLYRSATRIIVLLPRAGDYIEGLGIDGEKIDWISNGVEIEGSPPQPTEAEGFNLMYFGAHGGANGLDNVLRAMKIVENDPRGADIRLRLIGDGPLKPLLVAMAKDLKLSNVAFEASVPKNRIPALAAEADGFVICVNDMPNLYKYGISMNKLFDYMAAARPTIIALNATNNPIEEAGGGITVPPERPEALAAAIFQLTHQAPEERAEMGAAARRHVEEHYAYSSLAKRLAHTLNASVAAK